MLAVVWGYGAAICWRGSPSAMDPPLLSLPHWTPSARRLPAHRRLRVGCSFARGSSHQWCGPSDQRRTRLLDGAAVRTRLAGGAVDRSGVKSRVPYVAAAPTTWRAAVGVCDAWPSRALSRRWFVDRLRGSSCRWPRAIRPLRGRWRDGPAAAGLGTGEFDGRGRLPGLSCAVDPPGGHSGPTTACVTGRAVWTVTGWAWAVAIAASTLTTACTPCSKLLPQRSALLVPLRDPECDARVDTARHGAACQQLA